MWLKLYKLYSLLYSWRVICLLIFIWMVKTTKFKLAEIDVRCDRTFYIPFIHAAIVPHWTHAREAVERKSEREREEKASKRNYPRQCIHSIEPHSYSVYLFFHMKCNAIHSNLVAVTSCAVTVCYWSCVCLFFVFTFI